MSCFQSNVCQSVCKKAHQEVLNSLKEGKNVIFIAPTSYGKSKAVPCIQEALGLPRSVHAMPLRSLVQQQLNFLKSNFGEGCHASGIEMENKCPYVGGKRVVATVDYVSLILMRLPPPELGWLMKRSYGHYEYPRANLFTSLLVFDEAHLVGEPWRDEPSNGRDFLYAAIDIAKEFEIPTVIATATLPENELKRLARKLKADVVVVCDNCYSNLANLSYLKENLKRVSVTKNDVVNPTWHTEVHDKNLIEFINEKITDIRREIENNKRILIAVNTVPKAIRVYELLCKRLSNLKDKIVLVHGRLSVDDKDKAARKVNPFENNDVKIVVSTQVIEAGVDVDADWLITEAAPVSSLAQRAGRLCRSRKCETAKIDIVKVDDTRPYGRIATDAVKEIKAVLENRKGIEWRLLDSTSNTTSFVELINKTEKALMYEHARKHTYVYAMEHPLPDTKKVLQLLYDNCSFVRDTALIEVKAKTQDNEESTLELSLDAIARVVKKFNNSCNPIEKIVVKTYRKEIELQNKELSKYTNWLKEISRKNKEELCKWYSSLITKYGASSIVIYLSNKCCINGKPNIYVKGEGLRIDIEEGPNTSFGRCQQ